MHDSYESPILNRPIYTKELNVFGDKNEPNSATANRVAGGMRGHGSAAIVGRAQ